jgi:hypothetical protein
VHCAEHGTEARPGFDRDDGVEAGVLEKFFSPACVRCSALSPSQRNSGLRSLAVGATWNALGVIGWVLNALLWAAKDTGLHDVS